jgi:hypothetical protein
MPDLNDAPAPSRQVLGLSTNVDRFERLNSIVRPGLTEVDFRNLFSKCSDCGLVTTRPVFASHECRLVIDLTTDED